MSKLCYHVWIKGKVQRVGYRFNTKIVANQLNITGWVRNLSDGRVEAVFEGDLESLQKMILWCHQGPVGSVVEEVIQVPESCQDLTKFDILY